MSSRIQVVIEMSKEQRNEIKRKLGKEVTHIKLSVAPGAVIFAEALELHEGADG
jgi:hypothetical protein